MGARERRGRHRWPVATGAVALLVMTLLAVASCGWRHFPRGSQTVDDMVVYIGVVPAELVRGHLTEPGDPRALHGGTPKQAGSHHLVVALFDAKTGARITDASIRAGVGDRFYNHEPDKALEPMQIGDTVSYGNFFLLLRPGVWRIHLEIRRPGSTRVSEADFEYEHPPD